MRMHLEERFKIIYTVDVDNPSSFYSPAVIVRSDFA